MTVSNDLKIADLLIEKTLLHSRNVNTFMAPGVANNEYEEYYMYRQNGGYFPGNSVRIRLENMFLGKRGFSITPEPVVEDYTTLTLQDPISIPLQFSSDEATTKIALEGEVWAERITKPVAHTIVSLFNSAVASASATSIYNFVGSGASDITTPNLFYTARAQLSELGGQVTGLYPAYCAIHTQAYQSLTPELLTRFLPQKNEELYRQGTLGNLDGWDVFVEPNIYIHTSHASLPLDSTTVQISSDVTSGNIISLKGLPVSTTGIIKAGDLFSVAGTYKLNRITKYNTGRKVQFVATADADSDTSGVANVHVNPGIISDQTNPRVEMSGKLNANAYVTFAGSHVANLAWLQPTLTIVAPPLALLNKGAVSSQKEDPDTHMFMRYSAQDNIFASAHGQRMDMWPGILWNGSLAFKILSKIPS